MTKEILPDMDPENSKDEIAVRRLELMDELIKAKRDLESNMKNGFIMMSSARYIMGTTSVSMLQIPHEDCDIEASCHSFTSGSTDNPKFEISHLGLSGSSEQKAVCNRKQEDKEETKRTVDPIKWFSALPPQSLRQAQQSFKAALQRVSEIATVQSELQSLGNKKIDIPMEKLKI